MVASWLQRQYRRMGASPRHPNRGKREVFFPGLSVSWAQRPLGIGPLGIAATTRLATIRRPDCGNPNIETQYERGDNGVPHRCLCEILPLAKLGVPFAKILL
jgi:hypothetical protein